VVIVALLWRNYSDGWYVLEEGTIPVMQADNDTVKTNISNIGFEQYGAIARSTRVLFRGYLTSAA